jgi:hypothetical protein
VLPASAIIKAVQLLLGDGMYIEEFVMSGTVSLPQLTDDDSGFETLRQTARSARETLAFHELPYISAKTLCFFVDSESISVQMKSVNNVAYVGT